MDWSGNMDNMQKNPDDLLVDINKSIMPKGIAIALALTAIVVFGTSFGLYRDWAKYGLKTPSEIKAEKKAEQVEAEKARREAEIKRKAEEAAAVSSNAAPAQVSAPAKAAQAAGAAPAGSASEAAAAKKPPEIEPLPPASGEISLDEIGL